MQAKNPFASFARRISGKMEDSFEQEIRSLSGPRRVFQARTEAALLSELLVKNLRKQDPPTTFQPTLLFHYRPFSLHPQEYGIYFAQNSLLQESHVLFGRVKIGFSDTRNDREVLTDCCMVVFWCNIACAYFHHIVESDLFRLRDLGLQAAFFPDILSDPAIGKLIQDLSLAYSFRILSDIAMEAGIPSGQPFDYQWIARFYLRRKVESMESAAMDFIGDVRWFDGLEKLAKNLFPSAPSKEVFKTLFYQGIDTLKNVPVYLDAQGQIPAFESTLKSSPRSLEDVYFEMNPSNRKFFREILNMIEFSFELSPNLDHDVGIAIERGAGDILFELFPRTYTHSVVSPYQDMITITDHTLARLRELNQAALIDRLIHSGFQMEPTGRLVFALNPKIGWNKWNATLALLKEIINKIEGI